MSFLTQTRNGILAHVSTPTLESDKFNSLFDTVKGTIMYIAKYISSAEGSLPCIDDSAIEGFRKSNLSQDVTERVMEMILQNVEAVSELKEKIDELKTTRQKLHEIHTSHHKATSWMKICLLTMMLLIAILLTITIWDVCLHYEDMHKDSVVVNMVQTLLNKVKGIECMSDSSNKEASMVKTKPVKFAPVQLRRGDSKTKEFHNPVSSPKAADLSPEYIASVEKIQTKLRQRRPIPSSFYVVLSNDKTESSLHQELPSASSTDSKASKLHERSWQIHDEFPRFKSVKRQAKGRKLKMVFEKPSTKIQIERDKMQKKPHIKRPECEKQEWIPTKEYRQASSFHDEL